MSEFLTETPGWDGVWQWDTATQLKGGPVGPLNRQAQALLNQIAALRRGRVITPLDPGVGAKGDGVTDDLLPLMGMLTSLKKPGLDLSTSGAAKAALRGMPRVTVDLLGRTYVISQKLDLADLYNVRLVNGVLIASTGAVWGDDPMIYAARPQATDIYHDQRIRHVTLSSLTVDGNGVANVIYLENTFCFTLENFYGLGWPDGGKGLWTCDSSTSPNKSNTNLRLKDCVFFQKDAAEVTSSAVGSSGTCVDIQTADFFIDGLVCAYADVLLYLDNFFNGQVSNFHPYCKSTQKCLVLGPNAHHVAFSNIYIDTGIVELRSFDHSFNAGCQFLAGSQVKLIATVANEPMAGLDMRGIFANNPQYLTEGAGSWASSFRGSINGWLPNGAPIPSRGSMVLGSQSAARASLSFSDDTGAYYSTGLFSPAPNMMGYTMNGTEQWRFDDTGHWLLGAQTSVSTGNGAAARIQNHGLGLSDSTIANFRWTATAAASAQYIVARSASAAPGVFAAVQAGYALGRFGFAADDGANLNGVGAAMKATAFSAWSPTNHASYLTFQTTANGSATLTDRWDMRQDGHLVPVGPGAYDIGEAGNEVRNVYAQGLTMLTGNALLGYSTSISTGTGASAKVQLNSTGLSGSTASLTRWSSTAGAGGQLVLARSNSDTVGTLGAVQDGQVLGKLSFGGDDGANLNGVGAAMVAKAANAWTAGSHAAKLTFQTTTTGSTTLTDRWDVRVNGHVVPVGDIAYDIGEAVNQVRKIYAKDAAFTGSVTFPGPFANDAAAAAAGLALGATYRLTGGSLTWRQS